MNATTKTEEKETSPPTETFADCPDCEGKRAAAEAARVADAAYVVHRRTHGGEA